MNEFLVLAEVHKMSEMIRNQFASNGNRNQACALVSMEKSINREFRDIIVFTKALQTVYTHLYID